MLQLVPSCSRWLDYSRPTLSQPCSFSSMLPPKLSTPTSELATEPCYSNVTTCIGIGFPESIARAMSLPTCRFRTARSLNISADGKKSSADAPPSETGPEALSLPSCLLELERRNRRGGGAVSSCEVTSDLEWISGSGNSPSSSEQ
eukprot:750173-Hanusia_phi.AAC.7